MRKPNTAAKPARKAPEPSANFYRGAPDNAWARWTTQLPPPLIWGLKMRAAQEQRPIRETLRAAVEAYFETPVRRAD